MGLFSRIFYGVDLDEEQARSDALDAALRNEAERDRALYGEDVYNQTIDHIDRGSMPDIAGDVSGVFWQSIEESPITRAARTALPPQLIWAAALGIFLWAGGAGFLKGILSKK